MLVIASKHILGDEPEMEMRANCESAESLSDLQRARVERRLDDFVPDLLYAVGRCACARAYHLGNPNAVVANRRVVVNRDPGGEARCDDRVVEGPALRLTVVVWTV